MYLAYHLDYDINSTLFAILSVSFDRITVW